MASATVSQGPWPSGTTVGAYPAGAFTAGQDAPTGAAVASAVAGSNGAASFTGLTVGARYRAWVTNYGSVSFRVDETVDAALTAATPGKDRRDALERIVFSTDGRVVRAESATNDSANIAAALAGAGKATLQSGAAFDISASVLASVPAGRLDLNGATLRLVDGANQAVVMQSGEGSRLVGPGKIDGNGTNQTAGFGGPSNGVNVTASSFFIDPGVEFANCRNQAIRLDPAVQHVTWRIVRPIITNCLDHGIHVGNALGGVVIEPIINGTDRAGVVLSGGSIGTRLLGGWVNNIGRTTAGQAGVYFEGTASRGLECIGTTITNAVEYGLKNEPTHQIPGCKVVGVIIDGASEGVVLTGAVDWTVDVSVYNATLDGVNLITCIRPQLRGQMMHNGRSGVMVQGCTDPYIDVAAMNNGWGGAASLINGVTFQNAPDTTVNTRGFVQGVYSDDQGTHTQQYGLRVRNIVTGGLTIGPRFVGVGNTAADKLIAPSQTYHTFPATDVVS